MALTFVKYVFCVIAVAVLSGSRSPTSRTSEVAAWTTTPRLLHAPPVAALRHSRQSRKLLWDPSTTAQSILPSRIYFHFRCKSKIACSRRVSMESDDDETQATTKQVTASSQTLLEAILNLDPDWKQTSLDFTDPQNPSRCIPCHVAMMIPWDGVPFFIGTPVHTTVAVLCESSSPSSSSYFIDPDKEENLEIMERAVAEFYNAFGKEDDQGVAIQFQRCPRALTVVKGDITRITGYKSLASSASTCSSVLGEPFIHEILKDTAEDWIPNSSSIETNTARQNTNKSPPIQDEDDTYFHEFFRQELGDDYYLQSSRSEDETELQLMQKMMTMLDVDTQDKNRQQVEDTIMDEMIQDYLLLEKDYPSSQGLQSKVMDTAVTTKLETAIRLVRFQGPDGQSYTLTQLIQPMILVAKRVGTDQDDDDEIDPPQYVLLSPIEEQMLIPKLEVIIQQELSKLVGRTIQ